LTSLGRFLVTSLYDPKAFSTKLEIWVGLMFQFLGFKTLLLLEIQANHDNMVLHQQNNIDNHNPVVNNKLVTLIGYDHNFPEV
jgi:hypothetical protein